MTNTQTTKPIAHQLLDALWAAKTEEGAARCAKQLLRGGARIGLHPFDAMMVIFALGKASKDPDSHGYSTMVLWEFAPYHRRNQLLHRAARQGSAEAYEIMARKVLKRGNKKAAVRVLQNMLQNRRCDHGALCLYWTLFDPEMSRLADKAMFWHQRKPPRNKHRTHRAH